MSLRWMVFVDRCTFSVIDHRALCEKASETLGTAGGRMMTSRSSEFLHELSKSYDHESTNVTTAPEMAALCESVYDILGGDELALELVLMMLARFAQVCVPGMFALNSNAFRCLYFLSVCLNVYLCVSLSA